MIVKLINGQEMKIDKVINVKIGNSIVPLEGKLPFQMDFKYSFVNGIKTDVFYFDIEDFKTLNLNKKNGKWLFNHTFDEYNFDYLVRGLNEYKEGINLIIEFYTIRLSDNSYIYKYLDDGPVFLFEFELI